MKQKIAATISLITLALILALSSCAPISEGSVGGKGTTGSGGKNGVPITITLPPLGNASIRALSSEQVSRLQKETASYRVVFSGDGQNVTRSGSSSSFSASFPVGTQVSITVYCLNADGDVIVETVTKTITVSSGTNRLDFKLSEDGNEIIPSPPAPPPSVKSAVSYELDGGDWSPTSVPPQTEEYDEGATVTITTNEPTKPSFTFLGWKSSVSSLIPSGGGDNFQAGSTFTMPPSAVTFTAQWTNKPVHDVTYDLGFVPSGGSQTSTAQVPEGAAVSLTAPSVERKGYEFKYWMNGQAQAPSGLTMGNSDITLVADWNVITYTITYNANGGGSNPGNTTFTIEDSYVTFAASGTLAKTGYAFTNWETTSGQDVSNITNPADLINLMGGSTTLALTAVWTPISYAITYSNTNGGTGGADTTNATTSFTIETSPITFASEGTLEKIAYAFDGWETTSGTPVSGKNASELIALITSGDTLELQVKWIDGKRTVLYSDGALIINELPTARRTDTPTAVYAAMKDDGSNYIFTGTADIPWYNNKDSIFSVEIGSTIQPTSTKVWFAYLDQCISMDLENLDTSRVTNMDQMFRQCQKMTSLDLSSFDTSNVTDMSNMFYACGNTLVNLNVNNFDTSKVTAMNAMFASCSGLTNLDVSNFNTSKVTTMYNMFSDCSSLTTLDLHNFDISSATIFYMFNGCTSLTSLDISNFDTSKITDMQSLFAYCSNLKTIYVSSSFITDNVTDDTGMFSNCTSLVGGQGTAFDANNPTDKTYARIDNPPNAPGYFTQKP